MASDPNQVLFDHLLLFAGEVFPPLSATTRAEFAAGSRRAPDQTTQDHYLVTRLARSQHTLLTNLPDTALTNRFDEYAYAMVLADGLGVAGEIASRVAVSGLVALALRFGEWRVRVDEHIAPDIIERISTFYRHIDTALVHANRSGTGAPLHAALTAAVSGGRHLFFAHVGHSRAYLLRDGELLQITRDHTHAADCERTRDKLIDLTAAASDRHHILTDALGAGAVDPRIDIERLTLADGDLVMLCSNGLTDVVPDQDIAAILGGTSVLDERCNALLARAIESGPEDDVTVVLGRYHVPE
jgi:protein phosphatase